VPRNCKTLTLCLLLSLALVSACGTTRAFPSLPPQIDLRPGLRQACEVVSTPAAQQMPALEPAGTEAHAAQLRERAYWMEFVLLSDGAHARLCVRYLEIVRLVDAHNALVREAERSWPR